MIALILTLVLACSFTMALSEDELQLDRLTMSGNTTVTLTVDNNRDSYIVVIPSKVEIDPVTQYGEGTITLKSGWVLISVNKLGVKLTAAKNGIGDGVITSGTQHPITASEYQNFKMTNAAGNSVRYAIAASGQESPLYAWACENYYLLSVNKGENNSEDVSCTLTFYVPWMPPAGVYTDTLTFSIVTK